MPRTAPERARKHIYDRIAEWVTWISFFPLVILIWMGWDTILEILSGDRWWLVIGPSFFLSVFVCGAGFRYYVSPRIGRQNAALADIAEAVAGGDLTKHAATAAQGGQIGRLGRAMEAMTAEILRLAKLIRASTTETTTFANEITGGTEHLAQAASSIALTASTLSHQAVEMADSIGVLTNDTSRLGELARQLATGARDGLERKRDP